MLYFFFVELDITHERRYKKIYFYYDRLLSVDVSENIFNKYPVNYGDILFQRSSETREEVGTASVYLDKEKTATFGGFVIRGKKIGEYEPFFLSRLLQTDLSRNQITSKSGGSTRYNVGQEILMSIKVSFPTLTEQQKIATFLSTIDEKLQALKKKKSLLEIYKKGVMQKLFSQEIRFKNDEGNYFEDWEEKKLGEIGTFFSGGTPLTSKRHYFDGNIPFVRSGEINSDKTEQFISEEGLKNSSAKMIEVGDLIYALYGATSGEVGISKINGAINQAILCVRTNMDNRFLNNYFLLNKENIINTYLQGGQGNLSAEIIKSLEIPVPSLPEQTKIANFLTAIDEKITKVDAQIKQTELWKKGLLQAMFV